MEDNGSCINCGSKMTWRSAGFYICNKCHIKEYPDLSKEGTKADLNKNIPKPAVVKFMDKHEKLIKDVGFYGSYGFFCLVIGMFLVLFLQ